MVDWPPITHETRPWTRWWWLGSAVDEAGLTAELDALRAAGLGGVEITPIYGAAGAESRFVPFLSARWMELLEHTLREAQRVGLGVDMATGTGWPFGGPWVNEADACRSLMFKTWTVDGGARLAEPVRLMQAPLVRALGNQVYEVREIGPGESTPAGTAQQPLLRSGAGAIQIGDLKDPVEANANLQALALEQVRYPKPAPLLALVAYPGSGEPVDLTSRVDAQGTLQWVAPPGAWTLHAAFLGWHGKLVERAAPGGEGNVIDHFSRDAIRRYLAAFDKGFGGSKLPGLRAFFNDSYEVDDATGQADGTPALLEEFQRRRGYDLRAHLPALVENADSRVHADYRETVSDLLLETFTSEWSGWAKKRGRIVRNQAHGSPANLLDLYAASDIPETEGNDLPRFKWATSAAHVAGRRLVSAEAATWLGEHFRSTLADVRAAVDKFFVAGVNHIVYHGTAYSPREEPWPGWQFYASVEFNPRSAWWSDFGALNAYVTRVQSFLQAGEPDQDVLLYYPFHDALAARTRPSHALRRRQRAEHRIALRRGRGHVSAPRLHLRLHLRSAARRDARHGRTTEDGERRLVRDARRASDRLTSRSKRSRKSSRSRERALRWLFSDVYPRMSPALPTSTNAGRDSTSSAIRPPHCRPSTISIAFSICSARIASRSWTGDSNLSGADLARAAILRARVATTSSSTRAAARSAGGSRSMSARRPPLSSIP